MICKCQPALTRVRFRFRFTTGIEFDCIQRVISPKDGVSSFFFFFSFSKSFRQFVEVDRKSINSDPIKSNEITTADDRADIPKSPRGKAAGRQGGREEGMGG